jgi:hypothetical protein
MTEDNLMAEENGEKRERGPSDYAKKDDGQGKARVKTRFIFKFVAFLLLLLVAYVAWFFIRTGKKPSQVADLLDETKRTELFDQIASDYRTAVHASEKASQWAEREFKDWEHALSERLKSPPPKTKEESAALVKETKEKLEQPSTPPTPVDTGKPAGAVVKKAEPAAPKPAANPALSKAQEEYGNGLKAYAMTDPSAPQQQVQKYLRLAAGHFEVCLYWIDQARAQKVSESLIDPYEQPATKRLYDCRKRMELVR